MASPEIHTLEGLHTQSWLASQNGKIAIDLADGTVIDVNPAMEVLTGYCRAELLGKSLTALDPEIEGGQVVAELAALDFPESYVGFHALPKSGERIPVTICSSGRVNVDGRSVVIAEVCNSTRDQHERAARNWALSAFSRAAVALGHACSNEELKQGICEAITHQGAYVLAWIGFSRDDQEKSVRIAAFSGAAAGFLDELPLSWAQDHIHGQGPVGIALRTNEVQVLDDVQQHYGFAPWQERARRFGIQSEVAVPILMKDGRQAVLAVYSIHQRAFQADSLEIFEHLGAQLVHGIQAMERVELLAAEHERLETARRQLVDVLAATVGAMVAAMEMRDPYTAGHECRVADISVAIGREMGWDEGRLLGMRLAAMAHDVGKIAIPAEILTRPGRLSRAEFEIVKEHPERGYNILKDIPFIWPVATIVRQHHEKLDGSGYPLGIKGDEILLESRILAVADMVEAMASDRPYRPSRGLEFALKQVESEAGTTLDAEVVRICAALFREERMVVGSQSNLPSAPVDHRPSMPGPILLPTPEPEILTQPVCGSRGHRLTRRLRQP